MMHSSAPPPSLKWCLFLDVDGTLIEFTETPFDTRASEPLKILLQNVSTALGGALALVSGRSIDTLDELFAPLLLPCAGLHGVERRSSTCALKGAEGGDPRLDGARAKLRGLVQTHAGTLLEDKGRTLALHFRKAPQVERELRKSVLSIAASLGAEYQVLAGDMMLEIKPRGLNKGDAVRAFMRERPFFRRVPVYLGDDLTDLDGFRAVDALSGISIAVGNRVQAQYHLDDPAAVRAWLERIPGLAAPYRG